MSDVVVVGSGVAGASVAFAAARRGASVTIIDDDRPGRATAAGAGIIAPWASALTGDVYELYRAGPEAYPPLLDALRELGVADTGYARNGVLVLAADDAAASARLASLAERTSGSAVAGTPSSVDAVEIGALFPPLRRDLPGIHVPGGARVDGRRLAAALIEAVVATGGRSLSGTVTIDDGRVRVDGDGVAADTVVIAAGAWTPRLLGTTTARVEAQRGQICHLQLPSTPTGDWPSVLPPSDHYIVPFVDGRVVVGATREVGVDDVRITADGVTRVLSNALELAPGLADATLLETRVGLRPFPTVDHRPTIGRVDDHTWVVTGFGAIGLTIGPTVGERLAAMLLDDIVDPLLAPFAPG